MTGRRAIPALAVLALVAACGGSGGGDGSGTPAAAAPTSSPVVTASASPASTPTTHPLALQSTRRATRAVAAPAFRWHAAPVTVAELGKSWHAGCPVGPASLRAVTVTTWGFDRRAHAGTLVVASAVVRPVVDAFRRMYGARFPIRRMVPIAAYGGSDDRSMADDNTSAFNCRYAVNDGPKSWSMHAYGRAVDMNPLENPYTLNGRVYPPAGRPYTDRSDVRRGMVVRGSTPVAAFSAVGWGWGGWWSSSPDYQHFSSNGK